MTATDKARRLLADGCVMVIAADEAHTVARVRGDSGIHDVNFHRGKWSCTCPAFGECSHRIAVRLVTTSQAMAVA